MEQLNLFADSEIVFRELVGKPNKVEKIRIPYMGSKIKIAEQLIDKMLEIKPNARYFYDI